MKKSSPFLLIECMKMRRLCARHTAVIGLAARRRLPTARRTFPRTHASKTTTRWPPPLPCDDFDSTLLSAKFTVLWFAFGFAALPLVEEVVGTQLSLTERASLQLPLELAKAAASLQLLSASALVLPPDLVFLQQDAAKRTLLASAAFAMATTLALVSATPEDRSLDLATRGGAIAATLLSARDGPSSASFAASSIIVSAVMVAPWMEECFFRAWVLPSFCRWQPLPLAITSQAIVFALMHLPDSEAAFTQYLIAGMLYGTVAALARGHIAAPVACHSFYNAIALASCAFV